MKRPSLDNLIAAYVAEGDTKTAMRLYVENRISYARYLAAVKRGQKIKANGGKLFPQDDTA